MVRPTMPEAKPIPWDRSILRFQSNVGPMVIYGISDGLG